MVRKPRFSLSIVVLLMLLLPFFTACAGTPETPEAQQGTPGTQPTQPDAAPATDVTVSMPYLSGGITSFDHAYWTSQLLLAQGTIFEGLYGYDPQLNVVPKVAESATASDDNTVWTIKLREDKKWSNGDPVTAHDYYASWMRMIGPELKDSPMWAGMWGSIQNSWAYKSGAAQPEEVGLKVIDDYTIEITLTQPNAALTNLLAISSSMPINAKSLQEHPADWWDPQFAVFNGPYVVQAWVSGGDITLAKNPNYVGEGIGNVNTIVLKPYQDANARLQAFENGEIQFSFLEDASQLAYARNVPAMNDNIKEEVQNLIWRGIQYNRAIDAGPLNDIRVRQAFAMSIDKQAITESVLNGLAVPTNAFSGDPNVTEKITALPYDVARAKQLLADAGFPNGEGFPELTFYAPLANDPQMPLIEAVVKMWQDNLGVPIVIQNNEGPVYNALQWSNFNRDINPGFSTLGGPMNWFQPEDLLLASNHIWFFMDYKEGGIARYAEFQTQLDGSLSVTEIGDWDALAQRATAAWARRQEIIAAEDNDWGATMKIEPTFEEQFNVISERFTSAADDEARLSAYRDGLNLVLREEQSLTQYDDLTDRNLEAQRLMAHLRRQTIDEAWDTVVQLQQLAVDSAWMIPIYNDRIYYTTDPHLSGIVLNKLSWGGNFQYQYLQWSE